MIGLIALFVFAWIFFPGVGKKIYGLITRFVQEALVPFVGGILEMVFSIFRALFMALVWVLNLIAKLFYTLFDFIKAKL
jgi:hypothetical protein